MRTPLAWTQRPIIPGHEAVGGIDALGAGVEHLRRGQRAGLPWRRPTGGRCACCRRQRENPCDHPAFSGGTRNAGLATATVADTRFAFPLGEPGSDEALAPWPCAGIRRSDIPRFPSSVLWDERGLLRGAVVRAP